MQKQILPVNGWTLIKYQPYKEFIAPLSGEFLFWFIVLFSGLVAFIVLIYWLTNRTFINPATEFIQHIENCAQGDSGKIKPTEDWRHWFHVVEDIFSQNRSLMQQLKDKNADLDKLVKEKTQDLVETSEKHQRDYALLRSVMNAMQELIIFSDSEGKLIGCNLALEKFVQQKEQNILGLKACELLPQPMCASLHELSQQACNDSQQKAYQRVLKTSTQTFELFSRQFFNESDTLLGTINIFRDVSEAYAIQNALEKAKNQAEHANQAKGQFLANMSHEIRTPLNAIQGMMYLLAKTSLNKAQDQYLSNAETASKSLLNLIDELLDLAKIEAGKLPLFKTDVVLDQVIDKALKLNVGKALEKNLPVNICIAEDVPQIIYSDEVRLLQVLTNLLNNAIKFTHQGEVMLTVEMLSIANEAHIQFSVVDSGIGIAQEKQASLFNAFTQADESMTRKYGGSGLGLSICLQIVKLLGGEMKLTSEHTQGSTFSFSLPLANVIADKDATISFQLISVDTHLSSSLVATMAKHNCTYMPLANLSELESVICSTHDNDVLLLNVEQVEKLAQQAINISDKFKLIVLAIPMLSEISDNISLILEKSDINWIIAEAPIYRVILTQIEQALNFEEGDKHAIEGGESEQLNQPNLLLVEDNLVNQMVAQELLQSMNANVIIANNGQEALDLLAENNIDLVLMDIQMPVMDGLTATREIRKIAEFEVLPIIAMTAHAREEDRQHSLDAGMNLHIAKPVTYEKLLSSIKSLLVEK
ncbi:MAG: hypothetical protein COB35_04200 [Gammaproteobacteria bacterium]|nr:MAG: hypothetical protein COB35_04200 [Gammaproteobacteria bacterium]